MRISVRLAPKSSRNVIDRIETDAAGDAFFKVKVTAAPENGKANKALIKLLAKTWKLAPSAITLVSGAKDRNKVLLLPGDGPALLARIEAWALQGLNS
ncbi:MAG: DUF167 domain-containing protein [Sphingomonadales bacterium]